MKKPSIIRMRAQSTLRILASLEASQKKRLTAVTAELALIERILTVLEPELFESAVLEVLENTLQSALEIIDNVVNAEEGTS